MAQIVGDWLRWATDDWATDDKMLNVTLVDGGCRIERSPEWLGISPPPSSS